MPKVTEPGRAASGPVSLASSPVIALLCSPSVWRQVLFTPAHHATLSVHRDSWSYATETSGVQSEAHSIIERTLLVSHIQHVLGTSQYTLSSEGTPSSVLATWLMEGGGQSFSCSSLWPCLTQLWITKANTAPHIVWCVYYQIQMRSLNK